MKSMICLIRFLLPVLVGTACWYLGRIPILCVGLFLLSAAVCFPVPRRKSDSEASACGSIFRFACPETIRKCVYPLILICFAIVCFFSVVRNSQDPFSLKNDWFCVDLHDQKMNQYTSKVIEVAEGLKIFGNFTENSSVEADGRKLKRTCDIKQYLSDPETYYYDGITFITVSPKYNRLTAVSPRKIVEILANPCWLFAVLLALCLWSSSCESGLLPREASPVLNPDRFLLLVLTFFAVAFITWMYGQLVPIKLSTDGRQYLSFTAGNPIPPTIISIRTPGYPLVLKAVSYLSPMTHNALIVIQYGFYFLALNWLLYELYRAGYPAAGCLVLQFIFSQYMYTYHNFMLADSLNLSGLILVLAFSAAWYRNLSRGCNRIQLLCWHIAGALLIFIELMVKPFPGIIFIPGGMVFLMFIFQRKIVPAFRHAVTFTMVAMILPLLFCSYRYWKTGDFNFASLVSVCMCTNAIILHDPAKTSQLSPEVRKDMECIVAETLKAHPEMKLPPDLNLEKWPNDYLICYWNMLEVPGITNSSWFKNKTQYKNIPFAVALELECKKMLKQLRPCIDMEKVFKIQKSYARKLVSMLVYPKLTPEKFTKYSPFGKKMLWLLLLFISLALYWGRWNRISCCISSDPSVYNGHLMILLAVIAFLGVAAIFSTLCFFTVPIFEIRREVIGLFSIFFSAFSIFIYSVWYLAVSLLDRTLHLLIRIKSAE